MIFLSNVYMYNMCMQVKVYIIMTLCILILSFFVHGCSDALIHYHPGVLSLDNGPIIILIVTCNNIVIIEHYHGIVDIIHSGWQYSTLLGFILWSYISSRTITIE